MQSASLVETCNIRGTKWALGRHRRLPANRGGKGRCAGCSYASSRAESYCAVPSVSPLAGSCARLQASHCQRQRLKSRGGVPLPLSPRPRSCRAACGSTSSSRGTQNDLRRSLLWRPPSRPYIVPAGRRAARRATRCSAGRSRSATRWRPPPSPTPCKGGSPASLSARAECHDCQPVCTTTTTVTARTARTSPALRRAPAALRPRPRHRRFEPPGHPSSSAPRRSPRPRTGIAIGEAHTRRSAAQSRQAEGPFTCQPPASATACAIAATAPMSASTLRPHPARLASHARIVAQSMRRRRPSGGWRRQLGAG